MPQNIIKEINAAEEAAKKKIDRARVEAHAAFKRAKEGAETAISIHHKEKNERLKKYKAERTKAYEEEAKRLIKEGEEAEKAYEAEMKRKAPQIVEKIRKLIKAEICQ